MIATPTKSAGRPHEIEVKTVSDAEIAGVFTFFNASKNSGAAPIKVTRDPEASNFRKDAESKQMLTVDEMEDRD